MGALLDKCTHTQSCLSLGLPFSHSQILASTEIRKYKKNKAHHSTQTDTHTLSRFAVMVQRIAEFSLRITAAQSGPSLPGPLFPQHQCDLSGCLDLKTNTESLLSHHTHRKQEHFTGRYLHSNPQEKIDPIQTLSVRFKAFADITALCGSDTFIVEKCGVMYKTNFKGPISSSELQFRWVFFFFCVLAFKGIYNTLMSFTSSLIAWYMHLQFFLFSFSENWPKILILILHSYFILF